MGWDGQRKRRIEASGRSRDIRQGHGQHAAASAGEGVGDIVVLREHGLGVRHGGQLGN